MQTKLVLKQQSALKLRFQAGATGPAGTVAVGTTTTGSPGTSASVTNSGTPTAGVLNFTIPRGDVGPANALAIGTVTTGAPGSSASATITGTPPSQTLSLTIPRGDQGPSGSVTDGDKGDIVVSSAGTVWNVDPAVLTAAGRAITGAPDASSQRSALSISATNTPFAPAGSIAATNVQAAVAELDAKKVSKSGDTMTGGLVVPGITTPSTYGGNTAVVCGSYGTSGSIRFTRISDMGALGITSFDEANHNPGVSAARRFVVSGSVFEMNNGGNATAPGTWIDGSDGRVKDEREVISDPLTKIRKLSGYTYRRVDLPNLDGSYRREVGLIAQDVREVLPEAVIPGDRKIESDPEGEGFLSLNYNGVTALLVEGVKEALGIIETLTERIAALEARLSILDAGPPPTS